MTGEEPARDARTVPAEDVDDIIGIAAARLAAQGEEVPLAELEAIARDLDIPVRYVQQAIDLLARRRQEATARRVVRGRRLLVAGSVVACVLAGIGIVAQDGIASLRGSWAAVEARRAQVRTVLDRQAHVEARLRHEPPSPERSAALEGAENRVAVERRRYDEAASGYRAASAGWPARWWGRLGGLPRRALLSNEVRSW